MSQKERTRLGVMREIKAKTMTLVAAARVLRLGYRQMKRVWRRYQDGGDAGLVHQGRGRASNRAKSGEFKQQVLQCYEERYGGFGPTLACEHLNADDGLEVDHETLRRWLLAQGSWSRQRRRQKHRQWRERKACFGELVQMDGSHHDWFEGRRGRAVLMVMIDDATNRTHAQFFEEETTRAAFDVFEGYTRKYGLPQSLYVDRDSIYKTTREPSIEEQLAAEQPLTQFGRAMKRLAVALELAYSPQAKGRVERRNGLFQDRLVKELRLAGVNDLEAANTFLEEKLLPQINKRFCIPAAQPADVHRAVPRDLKEALSWEEARVVQQDWTITWKNRYFQIAKEHEVLCLARKNIMVRELRCGSIQLIAGRQRLRFKELPARPRRVAPKALTGKSPPALNHPWRKLGAAAGTPFWRDIKKQSRAARQGSVGLRSTSASLRSPSVPQSPLKDISNANQPKGDIFS
jgi:transposase